MTTLPEVNPFKMIDCQGTVSLHVSFIIYTVEFSFSLNTRLVGRLVGSVIKIPATDLADRLMEVQRKLKSTIPCSAGLQSLVSTRLTT